MSAETTVLAMVRRIEDLEKRVAEIEKPPAPQFSVSDLMGFKKPPMLELRIAEPSIAEISGLVEPPAFCQPCERTEPVDHEGTCRHEEAE
jgi:hypothetical protein